MGASRGRKEGPWFLVPKLFTFGLIDTESQQPQVTHVHGDLKSYINRTLTSEYKPVNKKINTE